MDASSAQSRSRRRVQNAQVAASGATLQLPSLPRFHPSTYGSNSSSMTTTPSSAGLSPHPPMSPRSQQRLSEAQRQLSYYQQTIIQQLSRDPTAANAGQKPPSPKLIPLAGSPGAMTPLELEGDNYLQAGSSTQQPDRLSVDSIIRDEARRRAELSPRRQLAA